MISIQGTEQPDHIRVMERVERWAALQEFIHPVPETWLREFEEEKVREKRVQIEECTRYEDVVFAWKQAMVWTKELDYALSNMLAVVTSVKVGGDQLWLKVISVASSGKTTIAEAVGACWEYVYQRDKITKFFSGYKTKDGEDTSIIPKINGKTLITKDGDTLLRAPDKDEILSQARALYDTSARIHYNNQIEREYENVRFTWILCGTHRLREIDTSDLGERFLDYVLVDKVDDETEAAINHRAMGELWAIKNFECNGKAETSKPREMLKAMAVTGGYVKYLRDNTFTILRGVNGSLEDVESKRIERMGAFVSYMRARPDKSKDQIEVNRELSTRLTKQLGKLALCTAAVLGHDHLSPEVMCRVRKVALDTARGKGLDIVRYVYKCGDNGANSVAIAQTANMTEQSAGIYLRHLKHNSVLETVKVGYNTRWKLTERFRNLYQEVHTR